MPRPKPLTKSPFKWLDNIEWRGLRPAEAALLLLARDADAKVVEQPPHSNRGPRIDEYNAAAGMIGAYYCANAVLCVMCEAGMPPEFIPDSPSMAASWIRNPKVQTSKGTKAIKEVARGDAYGWVNGNGTGHVGLVVSKFWLGSWFVRTVEANTTPEGDSGDQRNGGGLYRRTRKVTSNTRFGHYSKVEKRAS